MTGAAQDCSVAASLQLYRLASSGHRHKYPRLADRAVCGGCAQVRESTGPSSKNSPIMEDLLKAQEAAQSGNKGLWTKVGKAGFVAVHCPSYTGAVRVALLKTNRVCGQGTVDKGGQDRFCSGSLPKLYWALCVALLKRTLGLGSFQLWQ
jgi:hypothetical protein